MLSPNSSATLKPLTPGGTIKIKKNIWGPGTLNLDGGNIVMEASLGVAPAQNLLSNECWQYNGQNVFT